ncbi:MAG: fibronectin type III domain-containing protein, partial [Planctomycetes bacterium]|nr:fibronectin type III domain-containing protein [Planctomycetota bacterium]
PYEITPRSPADLRVVSSTLNSVSLAWTDRSFAEEGFEVERRSSIGFTPEILIAAGDAWRFFRGTQEPSAGTLGWAGVEFDDSAWEEGPSGFGYGDGDDATVLADMQNHYSTIYLRRTFDIEDAALFTGLKLLVDYDDGFVAYLNGVEVARMQAGLPGTFLPFDSLASDQHEAGEAVSVEFPVAGILRSGVNALAIQGLNINLSSTDFSLIPRLETVDETPFSLYAVLPADNRAFSDADLEPDTLYSYRVRAFNSEGTSAYSNIATLETAGVPSAPTDLRVVSVGDTSIGLEWTDTSDSESGFELERAAAEEEFERIAEIVADQTSYTDEGLASGETYSYRIRAVNIFGRSAFSNTVTQTTGSPPAAPSDLAIQEVFLDALRVVWVDNSEDETGFELQIRVGSAASFQQRAILLPDTTEYLDAELQPGETYAYRVRALGEAGNSDWSNEAAGETGTLPPAPADLTVSAVGLDSIALSWMSAAAAAQSLELERKGPGDESFLLLITLPPDATSHVDAALASGSTYAYRLRALNAFGSSPYSEVAEATTGRLPAQPSALSVVSFGLDWVEIGWLDNADNETGFELERSDAGGPFALAVLLSEGSTGVVDTGLAAGTHYAYRLRAVNAYGPSAYSEAVEVTTGRLPAAPAGLQVLDLGYDSLTLGWTDLSDNETGFAIERSEDGSTFTPAGQVSRDATIFSDVGLAQDTEYFYRVFATGEFGRSEGWAEIAVRTGRLPLAPSGLAAAAIGLDSVTIVWTDNSDNELRFDIYRKNAGGVFALVGHAGADTAVYEDTGLQPGTGYVYRIAAVGQFGPSDPSEELAVTTGRLPAAPVDLRATAIGLDYIELEWTDA